MTKIFKMVCLMMVLTLFLSLGMLLVPQAGQTPTVLASPDSLGPLVTEVGYISLSLDALGVADDTPGTIQVDKPTGATVRAAYMAAADVWGSAGGPLPDGAITLDGDPVVWSKHETGIPNHAWADVTSIVKPVVDAAPAGIVDLTVVETMYLDGSILAVIFNDPNQTVYNTVILLFGAQSTGGDTFDVSFYNPIDLDDPDFGIDFSLGISFGYQGGSQYSIVDVNSTRLTTSAGGQDDGYSGDGGLITVGGIGDSITNPPDPYQTPTGSPQYRYDDELYDLVPFVNDGDTSVEIDTVNPSNDDSIFFAALFMRSAIASLGDDFILPPPQAAARVNPSMGQAPHPVQFYDMSTGEIDSWFWEFGDGSFSEAQYPTHTYQNEGTYQACLTVEGPGGTDEVCMQVIVESAAAAPHLVVRNLYISGTQVMPRDKVVITADVFNEGGVWGDGDVDLIINGAYEQSVGVGVAPGTAQPISFTVYKVAAGEYQVVVGNAVGTFYVLEEQQPSQMGGIPMDSGTLIALIVIAVFVIAALVIAIVIIKPS